MDSIQCVFITAKDIDAVIEFSRDQYLRDEPLCHSFNLHGSTLADPYFRYAIEQGTSVMAIDTANGNKIVGVRAHRVQTRGVVDDTEPVEETDPRSAAFDNLVSFAFDRYNPWAHLLVDKFVHFKFLVVDKDYRGQNIGVKMTNFTLDWMREQGIPLAYVMVTNIYSKAVLEKAGFIAVDEMKYEDYKVDGKAVFCPEPIHTAFATLIKWVK